MNKKTIGKVLFNMREQDKVRIVDIETNKEFTVYDCCYHYDNLANKQIVEILIKEDEKT